MKLISYSLLIAIGASFVACQTEDDGPTPPPLEAAFEADRTTLIQGEEVTFTDQSTGVDTSASYQWRFEGGTPPSFEGATPPAIVYEDTGRFEVTLQISSGPQEDTETKADYITVQLDSALICSEDPFACTETVVLGSSITDKIAQANTPNVYEVIVDSSGVLEVVVEDIPGNLSLVSELLPGDNTETLLRRSETNAGRIYYELLVRPGTYYVVVCDQSGAVSEEDYSLTVNLDRTDTYEWNGSTSAATPLVLGETITGTLRTDEDEDYFELTVEQSGVLDIRLTSIPEVETGVSLLNANGDLLEGTSQFQRGKGDPAQVLYLIGEPGTYYIKLEGDVSSQDTYNLTATLDTRDTYEYNDRQNAASIELDEDIRGTLRTEEDNDWFEITLDQPGTLIARATTVDDSTDLRLFLYRPTGENSLADDGLSFSARNAGDPRSLYYLAEPGTYLIQLFNADAGGGGYDLYTLNVTLNTADPNELNNDRNTAKDIMLSQTVNGTISTYQDEDWFKITLPTGTARLTVTNVDSNVDMEAFLYPETSDRSLPGPDGFTSGNSIGAGEPVDISYNIEQEGTYFVQLRSRSQSVALDNNDLNQTIYTLEIE